MKKVLISFIITSCLLPFFRYEASSDCPQDYQSGTIQATYRYNIGEFIFTCDVTIYYCCKWDNDLKTLVFQVDTLSSTYNNCLAYITNKSLFMDWVHNTVALNATGPCNPLWPPCDDSIKYYIEVNSFVCKFYENRNISNIPGDPAFRLFLIKCQGTVKCVSKWEKCIDYSQSPAKDSVKLVDKYITGIPGCEDDEPQIPPQGKSWDEFWTTKCFVIPCEY
ncbi:hypothetical protein D9V86_00075 [Bacteroidetes/Chlorobi group bacterium ChocPot_Mid]|nr:MAG: hypothetical protein D9V86_00075 [Bacteroidetes/Chlorobi group bacterium ChocPot_Mid]